MACKTIVFGLMLAVAACGSREQSRGTELQRIQSGDLDIVLLASEPALKQGDDSFSIEFRKTGTTELVDVGAVKVSATMPMAGMPPMMASIAAEPSPEPGRYMVTSRLTMSGAWNIGVEWSGPAGSGSTKLSVLAQ